MPPRRSSRTRASVEPQPPSLPSSKRKRTSPNENEDPVEPRISKPPSKSGSTIASNRRTATRKSLEDVRESEGEYDDEDSPPPPKKSRPSLENEENSGEEEAEKKPSRARRAPARKASAASSKKGPKTVVKEEEAEHDTPVAVDVNTDSEDEKPRPKGRRVAKKAQDSSGDEFEDIKPARKARGGSAARASVPKPTRGRASSASKSAGRRGTRASVAPEEPEIVETKATKEIQESNDGNESDALSYFEADVTPKPATPSPKKARVATPILEVEEEEEHSLLEPQVLRTPSRSQPQPQATVAEEPQGPKSRLVIHKMALVNFKSYAGRQEIGPFHKVSKASHIYRGIFEPSLVLLCHRGPQRIGQVKYHRCTSFRIRL